jgi:hypothetical protein
MRLRRWVVWGGMLAGTMLVTPGAADAASFRARARWKPSTDTAVTDYRVYTRPAGGTFALALDAGLPAPGSDGSIAVVLSSLDECTTHGFVVTAVHADGSESGLSNEVTLSYAQVAPVLDSDGDGLTDAQEDRNLNCRVDAGETDPNRADTDGDGIGDLSDACQGTAPGAAVNASGCSCAQVTCNDGNACDGQETCTAGVCHAGVAPNCDDGNACTTDACNPASGCVHTAIPGCTACATDAQCDDGDVCNGRETCVAGVCRPGVALACDDGNACTSDACSPTQGCTHTAMAGCTLCTTAAQCDDGDLCTTDTCTGGRCAHAALPDGTSCDDGLFCDGAETCRSGVCTAGAPVGCDDGNACTTDACDEATRRCTHTALADCCTSDADCKVADACQTNERCSAGRCVADAVICPNPGPCASAACDPQTGCQTVPLPDGTACDDGNACTSNDACVAGVCGGSTSALADVSKDPSGGGDARLALRATARGLHVLAHGSLADLLGGTDPTAGQVNFVLEDAAGTVLLDVEVPGSEFAPTNDGRLMYKDDHRKAGGGFTSIELRPGKNGGSFTLRALVADAGRDRSSGVRAATKSSAQLKWSVKTGSGCVAGGGACSGHGRQCR